MKRFKLSPYAIEYNPDSCPSLPLPLKGEEGSKQFLSYDDAVKKPWFKSVNQIPSAVGKVHVSFLLYADKCRS
eukprot:CAMPEP_0114502408 /NCGR_PEP_ID=MMETSP0109-20121206/9076_1 /TAXON_ID=29199 /ORGANISM="Chlorarachnion reptans, Strain CCCM449" /LENGTH=72 /DNA_ID=CAMNT_0001680323 /DNA_START=77 /DNA_END=291 /DNA_ORIENTATION=+